MKLTKMKLKKDELFEIYENKHKREIFDEEEESVINDGIENKKKVKYITTRNSRNSLFWIFYIFLNLLDIEVNDFKRFRLQNF